MKNKLFFTILLIINFSLIMAQDLIKQITDKYEQISVSSVKIKQNELFEKINEIKTSSNNLFTFEKVGESFEGRDIDLVKLGNGKRKVFLWSQMHGDEPTATLAILDILNCVSKNKDEAIVKKILQELTVLIIPMLNPDGAERFTRRNAQDIDINRDAKRLQTPEGRLLKNIRDKYEPEFGFNLHDQDPYFAVGNSDKLVTIALLAPAMDDKNTTNPVRKKAKLLVTYINDVFSKFIEGHVSKYNDEFEERAFGDNIQKWGTSTILIESGGYVNDAGKDQIRKLNFIALIAALNAIATESYLKEDLKKYDKIEPNDRKFFDLLIRNCNIEARDSIYIADLGINFDKDLTKYPGHLKNGRINDLGDLSTFYGVQEFDASKYDLSIGSYILLENNDLKALLKDNEQITEMLLQGVTSIISNSDANLVGLNSSPLNIFFLSSDRFNNLSIMLNSKKPILPNSNFISKLQDKCYTNPFITRDKIKLGKYADLVFFKNRKVKDVFVNGIMVLKDGKLLDEKPGIIYLEK